MHCRHRFVAALAASVIAGAATAQPPQPPSTPGGRASELRGSTNVSDAQIGLEARARLYEELGVSNLSVLVTDGVATIDGSVSSEEVRQRAERITREMNGIDRVVNELKIVDSQAIALAGEAIIATERENARIEQTVTAQLRSNAVLGSRPITVVSDELTSTITLTGTVDTEDEKERAAQIAANAFPAGTVRNQLEVRQRL